MITGVIPTLLNLSVTITTLIDKALRDGKEKLLNILTDVTSKLETIVGDLRLGTEAVLFWTRTKLDDIFDDLEETQINNFMDNLQNLVSDVATMLGKNISLFCEKNIKYFHYFH